MFFSEKAGIKCHGQRLLRTIINRYHMDTMWAGTMINPSSISCGKLIMGNKVDNMCCWKIETRKKISFLYTTISKHLLLWHLLFILENLYPLGEKNMKNSLKALSAAFPKKISENRTRKKIGCFTRIND